MWAVSADRSSQVSLPATTFPSGVAQGGQTTTPAESSHSALREGPRVVFGSRKQRPRPHLMDDCVLLSLRFLLLLSDLSRRFLVW